MGNFENHTAHGAHQQNAFAHKRSQQVLTKSADWSLVQFLPGTQTFSLSHSHTMLNIMSLLNRVQIPTVNDLTDDYYGPSQ